MSYCRYPRIAPCSLFICSTLLALCVYLPANSTFAAPREQLIPILTRTMESGNSKTMAYLIAGFENRRDRSGLILRFNNTPGRLSRAAQTSIAHAIRRTAESLSLSTDSWTVVLSVPYPDTTIYGDGLSAMVGLSVAAMATGRTVTPGLVMSATITPEGHIGPVGSVPLKIPRTGRGHLRRILVSKDQAVATPDESLVHVQVSQMNSITEAFEELTARAHRQP